MSRAGCNGGWVGVIRAGCIERVCRRLTCCHSDACALACSAIPNVLALLSGWRSNPTLLASQALAERRRWDLVVFDPPKLAPSRKTLEKATRKYRRLNALAMQVGAIKSYCGGWVGG